MNQSIKSHLLDLDTRILLFIQRCRPKKLNQFFVLITYTGTGKAWFCFAIILNILHFLKIHFIPNQDQFLKAMFAPLLAWMLGSILKRFFSRTRPSLKNKQVIPLAQVPSCGSFPSSHAASTIAFFFALLMLGHPWAIWIGIWALLVSFSRLYLGVHYASDVFGGALLGYGSSLLVVYALTGGIFG